MLLRKEHDYLINLIFTISCDFDEKLSLSSFQNVFPNIALQVENFKNEQEATTILLNWYGVCQICKVVLFLLEIKLIQILNIT